MNKYNFGPVLIHIKMENALMVHKKVYSNNVHV